MNPLRTPLLKRKTLYALIVLLLPLSASGDDPYQAVIAGWPSVCRFEVIQPSAEWVPSTGHEVSNAATVAGAPGGRVFAAMTRDDLGGRGVHVEEIRVDGTRAVVSETIPGWEPLSLAVDRSGRMYVLAQSCQPESGDFQCSSSGPDAILTFDAQGGARPIHVLGTGFASPAPSPVGAMDLAADQCTLFLIQNDSAIRRFNVCTGSFLPDFATVNAGSYSLRILPDGGLLVGRGRLRIERYTADGAIARTYAVGGGAIGLASAGNRAWTAQQCGNDFSELDLATGDVRTIAEIPDGVLGVVPHNGWSAAVGAFHTATVPTASMTTLALLAAMIAAAAILRLP